MKAVSILEKEGIKTNMTALMSVNQAVIKESREILDKGNFKTKILVQMPKHPKTEETIKEIDSA